MTLLAALLCTLPMAGAQDAPGTADDPRSHKIAVRQARRVGRRWRQPQDPYRILDISAYTLERGEARIGLWSVAVGVTPWLQLGTRLPLLSVAGPNLHAKVHAIRRGPVDIALFAEGAYVPRTSILTTALAPLSFLQGYDDLWSVGGGATLSVRALPPWTLHLTVHALHAAANIGVDCCGPAI